MILELTDQQKRFQQKVAAFSAEKVAPQAAEIDATCTFPTALVA